MTYKHVSGLVLAGALLGLSSAANAQSASLVNVDLRNADILNNIANNLSVDVSNVPVTVLVPVALAANVCDIDVSVLANTLKNGTTTC